MSVAAQSSLRKVAVEDLIIGMYVAALDRPWLETSFLFQGFLIESHEALEDLRRQCDYVYIDIEKGPPASRYLPESGPLLEEDPDADVFRVPTGYSKYPERATVQEELESARDAYRASTEAISSVLDDIRAGRKIGVAAVRDAVRDTVGSVIRNPDAFLWLTRLKKKDDYTYAHCVDACGLAVAFGRHLGFSRHELENLAIGTLLIDVGKMKLPEGLLQKPGRLTPGELALFRRHVEFGVQIVSAMEGANPLIVDTVLHHHERHNGKGYPQALPGHRIPVFGRIASIVDCYDAITSDRPYARAVSSYAAIQKLYEWRDKDFQSDMIEQFIQCLGVFPVGTLVELSTGEVGIVFAQNRVRRLRPKIVLVLDGDKVALDFNPVLDLIENPLDSDGRPIEIRRALEPGAYGVEPQDFYL
ncbi:HD-GYP domain-containing protein [Thiohalobacter sp. IOR34]|uniref:HD-GYP domain-containing protein n=1 Tax=Thiohalobacter sp. IOR34 TaxID=3057176 RepID=UPI0025AFFD70|nr:HD-GYP domain-containing protein [Thiohalobacter sp. IOR34]WJW75423.1 HD-GYP domain-containing protein [Thiohalobacter sp. IOR34]